MPYDSTLAERMRPMFLTRPGSGEKNMFGGIGFFVYGNMCCGIWKHLLVVRLPKEEGMKALKEPHVREMDITGKPMRGWLLVEPAGFKTDGELVAWINRAYDYAVSLPKK